MMWLRNFVWAVAALAAAACSSTGAYAPAAPPPLVEIEQVDRVITYAVDPALDDTTLSFACGALGGTSTYELGDALGRQVRDVFSRRYSQASEVAPERADVVVTLNEAILRFEGKQGTLTYHILYRVSLYMALLSADGELRTFAPSADSRDDVFRTFFDVCGSGAEMIDRLVPELLANMARSLIARLD